MNSKLEKLFKMILILILVVLPLSIFGYRTYSKSLENENNIFSIRAAIPEAGGFDPENIRVAAGEPFILKISVPDVVHSISIGPGLDINLGNIYPGEQKSFELQIDKPGRYTAYCNTWCSPNHWRMRLNIEVYDPDNPDEFIQNEDIDEIIKSLQDEGINIDEPHLSSNFPKVTFDISIGKELFSNMNLPDHYLNKTWLRSQSPQTIWESLIKYGLNQQDAWNIVAYLWESVFEIDNLEKATYLYSKNCAACHGENGEGDGPGVAYLKEQNFQNQFNHIEDETIPAFSDLESMLGGSGWIFYAKIRRGGMGTGMPGFGPVFSEDESWLLADYLWQFVFQP